ncbi:hypothetical protein [Streptomyces sp. NPDC088733]|uniref:hypothetical protein n=1 Tax=Streptomyces sp. NPDC088733 TaxID=3365880 RepID=UPI0037F7A483
MSGDISVSEEYVWTTSSGMFWWIVEHLKERVTNQSVWACADKDGFEVLKDFRVYRLPEPGRREVLRVLVQDLPSAYGAWAREHTSLSEAQVAGAVHNLEILAMMATEVLRERDNGSAG